MPYKFNKKEIQKRLDEQQKLTHRWSRGEEVVWNETEWKLDLREIIKTNDKDYE